jgi:hypothetical protein
MQGLDRVRYSILELVFDHSSSYEVKPSLKLAIDLFELLASRLNIRLGLFASFKEPFHLLQMHYFHREQQGSKPLHRSAAAEGVGLLQVQMVEILV